MKNAILFSIVTLVSLTAFCQNTNFPIQDAQWSYHYYDSGDDYFSFPSYTMHGDSVYNGINYQLINSTLVRSDSNVVYFIPPNSVDEFVLYDFNIEVGDTFFLDYVSWNNTACTDPSFIVLSQIGTVTYEDNVERKKYYFGSGTLCGFGSEAFGEWVEGIGCITSDVLNPFYGLTVGGSTYLMCFNNNGTSVLEGTYYTSNYYNFWRLYGCGGEVLDEWISIEDNDASKLSIGPNPFSNRLIINFDPIDQIDAIRIYNQNLQEITFQLNANEIKFQKNLEVGIYYCEVDFIDGRTLFKKLVKH